MAMMPLPELIDHLEKIDKIDVLLAAWSMYPSLRLGQFIVNAMHQNNPDLFYIKDSDLLEKISKFDVHAYMHVNKLNN